MVHIRYILLFFFLLCSSCGFAQVEPAKGNGKEFLCTASLVEDWMVIRDDGILMPYNAERHRGIRRILLLIKEPKDSSSILHIDLPAHAGLFLNDRLLTFSEERQTINVPLTSLKTFADSTFMYLEVYISKGIIIEAPEVCFGNYVLSSAKREQVKNEGLEDLLPIVLVESSSNTSWLLLSFLFLLISLVASNSYKSSTNRNKVFQNLSGSYQSGFTSILAIQIQTKDLFLFLMSAVAVGGCFALASQLADFIPQFKAIPPYGASLLEKWSLYVIALVAYVLFNILLIFLLAYMLKIGQVANLHVVLLSKLYFYLAIVYLVFFLMFVVSWEWWPRMGIRFSLLPFLVGKVFFLLYLFLRLKNVQSSKNVYFISYICATEILPALVMGRFLENQVAD